MEMHVSTLKNINNKNIKKYIIKINAPVEAPFNFSIRSVFDMYYFVSTVLQLLILDAARYS